MFEQSKSAKRRYYDGAFAAKYFVGYGIDIGCGPDSVGLYKEMFTRIVDVDPWDLEHGDAQLLASVPNEHYDFVHSSHSLEHMVNPVEALENWIRVLKPDGHLIITVPDEDMYEHGVWPSVNNGDHKWSFTISKASSTMPNSLNVIDLLSGFAHLVKPLRILLLDDFFNPKTPAHVDQTLLPNAECAIEIICRKL